jgi:hypothetical protein
MDPLTVEDVLDLRDGALVELTRGEALIRGRWESSQLCGIPVAPMLIMNADIGHGYNVVKMIELGWKLRILTGPAV